MIIYVEYAIFDNIIVAYLTLSLALAVTRTKISKFKFAILCLIFGACSLIIPLLYRSYLLTIIFKILLCVLMTLIVIDNNKIKKSFATFFISLLSTHLLFYAVLNVGVKLLNGNVYYALYDLDFPITAILLAVFLYFKILLKYFCKVKRKSKIENFIYDCTLYYKDKKINCIGFLDTGNSLYDGNMNLPIIVAPIKAIEKFLNQYELICIMLKKQCETVTNLSYINYATASTKNSVMPVFKLDKIIVKQETKKMQFECMLGISFTNFKSANYDILLNEKMLNK